LHLSLLCRFFLSRAALIQAESGGDVWTDHISLRLLFETIFALICRPISVASRCEHLSSLQCRSGAMTPPDRI
jgi:hypothetical protein